MTTIRGGQIPFRKAYFVVTQDHPKLPNDRVHPNTGSPDYHVKHDHLTDILNVGTKTHADLDSHLASTTDPHSSVLTQNELIITNLIRSQSGAMYTTNNAGWQFFSDQWPGYTAAFFDTMREFTSGSLFEIKNFGGPKFWFYWNGKMACDQLEIFSRIQTKDLKVDNQLQGDPTVTKIWDLHDLVLPTTAPSTPSSGSIYWDEPNSRLGVYDATAGVWKYVGLT